MGLTPNVVANTPIASTWGNEIRDRTFQAFTNAAERSAQWIAPPVGAHSVLLDNPRIVHVYAAGAWIPLDGPRGRVGYKSYSSGVLGIGGAPGGTFVELAQDIAMKAGRRYRNWVGARLHSTGVNAVGELQIRLDGVVLATATHKQPAAGDMISTVYMSADVDQAADATRHWEVWAIGGGGYCEIYSTVPGAPAISVIEDAGPTVVVP